MVIKDNKNYSPLVVIIFSKKKNIFPFCLIYTGLFVLVHIFLGIDCQVHINFDKKKGVSLNSLLTKFRFSTVLVHWLVLWHVKPKSKFFFPFFKQLYFQVTNDNLL